MYRNFSESQGGGVRREGECRVAAEEKGKQAEADKGAETTCNGRVGVFATCTSVRVYMKK